MFLGLCSYYRKFAPEFSEIAAPLHSLARKNRRFQRDETCQESFEERKVRLISSPVLVLPRDEGDYIVDMIVSDSAVGSCVVTDPTWRRETGVVFYSPLFPNGSQLLHD